MSTQNQINYKRIAKAIGYIKDNFRQQPDLEEVAEQVNLSPAHFQRLFTEWAGVSPKKFLQYISVEYAKHLLQKNHHKTLFDAAFETGLSSTSRLHDLFVNIEGMTPAEYKNGGQNLSIRYSFSSSPFGEIIIASTIRGVCYLAFYDDENQSLVELKNRFPNADFQQESDENQKNALTVFTNDWTSLPEIKLHLKGTDFQLKVWESLLKIPFGKLVTYSSVAENIGRPKASRAVGTAIGSNPIAYLIPCHRVIQTSGALGGYMWGNIRKSSIIGWEAANINSDK